MATRRFAVLCPGQAGQHAAMFALAGAQLPNTLAALLGTDLNAILTDPARLFSNRFAQPLVVAAGLAQWAQLRDLIPPPALIAGYSVGELTAYGISGALSTPAVLTLADQRARLTSRCVDPQHPQAMVAIGGLSIDRALPVIEAHGFFLAIKNGGDRLIAGGLAAHCAYLEAAVVALGGDYQRLPLTVAAHTPFLAGATTEFAAALAASPWLPSAIPVLSGIGADKILDSRQAITVLTAQLTCPIQWDSCMDALLENSIEVALEIGPGQSLSRMLRARHPAIECRAIDEFRSIGAVAAWLHSQLNGS